jgi:hypothetical protein
MINFKDSYHIKLSQNRRSIEVINLESNDIIKTYSIGGDLPNNSEDIIIEAIFSKNQDAILKDFNGCGVYTFVIQLTCRENINVTHTICANSEPEAVDIAFEGKEGKGCIYKIIENTHNFI